MRPFNLMIFWALVLLLCVTNVLLGQQPGKSDQSTGPDNSEVGTDDLHFQLKIQIRHLINECDDLLSEDELERWRDQEFLKTLTKRQATEIVTALSKRVYRIASDPIPVITRRVGDLTIVCFGLGEYELGLKHLDRLQLALVTAPNDVTYDIYEQIGAHFVESVYANPDFDLVETTTTKLIGKFKSLTSMIPIQNVDEFMGAKSVVDRIGKAVFGLKDYDAALAIYRKMRMSNVVRENKENWSELGNGIGAYHQYFLWHEIQCQMALGNRKEVEKLFVEYLDYWRKNRMNWWKAKGLESAEEYIPDFSNIWHDCTRLGYGATYPRGRDVQFPEKQMRGVGFFQSRMIFPTTPVPISALPEKGQQLKKEMEGHVYFKSDKIEKAIKAYCDEPAFEKFDTVVLLRFLLVEYQLTNGHGAEAAETLKKLESDWKRILKAKPRSESTKKLLEHFSKEDFEFHQYKHYLCTYFDNDEFRKIVRYSRPWKFHQVFFHYERKIPEHATKKPTLAKTPK